MTLLKDKIQYSEDMKEETETYQIIYYDFSIK